MEFFKNLEPSINGIDLVVTINKKNDLLHVSVLPKINVKDDSVKVISPFVISGTAAELDAGFFEAINKPLEKVSGLAIKMDEFEKSVDTAEKESKMNKPGKKDDVKFTKKDKASKVKEKTPAQINSEKAEKLKSMAVEFEETGKLKEAIGAWNEAKEFVKSKSDVKIINESVQTLANKINANELFPDDKLKDYKSNHASTLFPVDQTPLANNEPQPNEPE